jgi:hypothetical protein
MKRTIYGIAGLTMAAGLFLSIAACKSSSSSSGGSLGSSGGGIHVSSGTWSYVLSATGVPLTNSGGAASCAAPDASGTTVVNSSGAFTIPFAGLTCSNCAMSGTILGVVVSTGVAGTVSATTSGLGCSNQQPSPNPALMTGTCTATSCTVGLSSTDSFAVSYTLTPP